MNTCVYRDTLSVRPYRLTAKDVQLLAVLWLYHHLTAQQIARALYRPTILACVRPRLKLLVESILVSGCWKRPSRSGSAPLVYLLGPQGVRHLRGLGYSNPPLPSAGSGETLPAA